MKVMMSAEAKESDRLSLPLHKVDQELMGQNLLKVQEKLDYLQKIFPLDRFNKKPIN